MGDKMFELTEEDFADLYLENNLTRALDEALAAAKSGKYRLPLFFPVIGMTGSGKTSTIQAWLKHHKLKNWYICESRSLSKVEVEYFSDFPNDSGVALVSNEELEDFLTPKKKMINVLFSSDEIDDVDDQTIIVVDDYDRCSEEVRKELFQLIHRGCVTDPRADNNDKIKVLKPLMIIAVLDYLNAKVLNEEESNFFGLNDM